MPAAKELGNGKLSSGKLLDRFGRSSEERAAKEKEKEKEKGRNPLSRHSFVCSLIRLPSGGFVDSKTDAHGPVGTARLAGLYGDVGTPKRTENGSPARDSPAGSLALLSFD